MRLAFTDMDGVLNKNFDNCSNSRHIYNDRFSHTVTTGSGQTCELTYVDPELAARVSKLITDYDMHIVASTSWRLYWSQEDFKELLTLRGLPGERLVGYTPNLIKDSWFGSSICRADEIRAFLNGFDSPVEFCIVLDDDPEAWKGSDPKIMFCKTDFDEGYTKEDDEGVRKWIEEFLRKEN